MSRIRIRKARWIRSTVTGVVTAAIAAALCPAAGAQARPAGPVPQRYTEQRLAWQPCAPGATLECAPMTVPRDWRHPGTGADLTVQVSRQRAADPARRRGTLLMAAGGPGGEGLLRPTGFVKAAPKIAEVYDVVGFDQRGVGRSTRVSCQDDAEFTDFFAGDFRDRSPAALARVLDNSRKFVAGCRARSGDLLPYVTTEQTARDIDLYRALLGERKISYYGPSYATKIGATYATLFPQRVERAVLDSNIAFDGTWEEFEKGQPMSYQRRFEEDFLPWLARYDRVYHYGRTPAEAKANWERRRGALAARPLTIGGGKTLAPNQFDNGAILALYKGAAFPVLAGALAALDHWDTATDEERRNVDLIFGRYLSKEFLAEFFAVTCNDTPWTRDTGHWVRQSAKDTAAYPLMGARELAFAATCAAWPAGAAPRVDVTGKGLPPVLMLNSRHDPATHYEGALRAHKALRGSRLVTVTGGDHGQYLEKNACVDTIVDRYLLTGAVPDRDTACEGNPLPVPAEPAA
ncbi:peptidase [Streptomyces eurocidicus]|uniref:Peptidase n=1 Tax=Streptomyces eurocidicus TaxID=66423 RepID=A0A2N8NQ82_STREU|nr:alpha/beta hydrolase [Streptomyces eurocidicus]MBB5121905.1 pimeloyl-ACP methyl ester carboxylesterase [Streptomyces eurocidicus]MBF6051582.1 alpha/beta fold hydrolase [Streptomyces eurocidicus]PNE30914.1 peptidase [Streptomyces eurocidicus]